jgi:hypothetical protein
VTLILVGVLFLALSLGNRYVFGQLPMTTRGAEMLPLMRRLNIGLAILGVAAILLGLLFPEI